MYILRGCVGKFHIGDVVSGPATIGRLRRPKAKAKAKRSHKIVIPEGMTGILADPGELDDSAIWLVGEPNELLRYLAQEYIRTRKQARWRACVLERQS